MKIRFNTQQFADLLCFKSIGLCLCLIYAKPCMAQEPVQLNDVEVITQKNNLSGLGKNIEVLDSAITHLFVTNSLADLLTSNSNIFIKNYGPGSISTTAFRGGNASQTALLWNGFNIQNPMLGQSDLSLMPVLLFDQVALEFGGSSALWGSGAVGGSIHLNNNLLFNRGVSTRMQIGSGSFGLVNASAGVQYSKQKFVSSTKMYGSTSKNNFKYIDEQDPEKSIQEQQHAAYLFRGVMQEMKWMLNSKQLVSFNVWLNANDRQIPSTDQSAENKSSQKDNALRATAAWNYFDRKFTSTIRGAYFLERINYTDSLSAVYSKNVSRNLIVENENFLKYHQNHQLHFGINVNSSSAQSDNYLGTPALNKVSLLLGNNSYFFKDHLLAYVGLRAEYISVGVLPLTGNAALEYQLSKTFKIRANVSRVYRQPTLNELYWLPGGNINLKPEQGNALDGSLSYEKPFGNYKFSVTGAAYSRWINNWILWVPAAGNTSMPINVQEVWSRGGETSWKLRYTKEEAGFLVGLSTSYVLSTVQSSEQENNNSIGKQLIYTPRYMGNMQLMLWYEKTSLTYFQQYTGYRFTSSDNSQWLDPYHLASLKLNYSISYVSWNLNVFISCNNLFNSNYTVLAGRPMPLRNFELGITLNTNQPNK